MHRRLEALGPRCVFCSDVCFAVVESRSDSQKVAKHIYKISTFRISMLCGLIIFLLQRIMLFFLRFDF